MTLTELYKHINFELDWLRYYASHQTRQELKLDSDEIYDILKSIGWTKRNIRLDIRCCSAILTSKKTIELSDPSELILYEGLRNRIDNKFTPVEYFWMRYPERRIEIIENLNATQSEVKNISNNK